MTNPPKLLPEIRQAVDAMNRRDFMAASDLLSRALATNPGNAQARWLLVQCLEAEGQSDQAEEHLKALLEQADKNLPAIDQVAAHCLQKRYSLQSALQAYSRHSRLQPRSAVAAFNFAWYLAKNGDFEEATREYERSLSLGIDSPEEAHLNIATILMDQLGQPGQARKHLEEALALDSGYAAAWYNLGNLSEQSGDREGAKKCFEHALRADPANVSALARLADTRVFTASDDPLLARLEEASGTSENADLQFVLGKACEQLGQFDKAWQHYSNGNALDDRILPPYDRVGTETKFAGIRQRSTGLSISEDAAEPGGPVFICGMFRSGSTLLEQMLAAHPSFTAGGELQFFPRLVAKELPGYPEGLESIGTGQLRTWQQAYTANSNRLFGKLNRVTDKRPDNFLCIGLIKAVLPSAKIIVTERDWRDVATSIFSVRLGAGQPWARNLANIRHYIGIQEELIDFWQQHLGNDIVRIEYEALVREPERTLTGLLQWLGEDWDPACLDFHQLQNSVRTASVWQVREPLHQQSIGRWKRFEERFVEAFGTGGY